MGRDLSRSHEPDLGTEPDRRSFPPYPPARGAFGALLLADSLPYIAEDAVVLAVVDPNVGKDREVAIETASGRILVGPDNGLLGPACESAGGVHKAVEITSDNVIEQPIAE